MAKILIVEDDPRLEMTFNTIFQRHGHTVVRAHDGEEGLMMAQSENPDLILLDMLMPKMHGIEFLKAYDIKNKHPDARVICFSNMESPDLEKQAIELGALRYEVKSRFSPNQLAALVNETLGTRPKSNPLEDNLSPPSNPQYTTPIAPPDTPEKSDTVL
jgi:DNA-binding response OmpR family regulator